MAGQPFDSEKATVGSWQNDVDPTTFFKGQPAILHRSRIDVQIVLMRTRTPRFTPIEVTTAGVLIQGHHACRAAIELGMSIDVKISPFPVRATGKVSEMPILEKT